MIALRLTLAAGLLAIAAWVVAWRRARPDLAPRFLAVKLVVLLAALAVGSVSAMVGPVAYVVAVGVSALVAHAVAWRLWHTHRWLARPLGAEDAAREARRLATAALEEAGAAEREEGRRRG